MTPMEAKVASHPHLMLFYSPPRATFSRGWDSDLRLPDPRAKVSPQTETHEAQSRVTPRYPAPPFRFRLYWGANPESL